MEVIAGTRVVLFDTGGDNDRKKGVSDARREANIGQIANRIRACMPRQAHVNPV